jgi:hypothetical protein
MMPFLQNCKTLFVFSDPGGAKACLAMAENFSADDVMIISDRNYGFYEDFVNIISLSSIDEISSIIDNFSPKQVITGTSYTSKIELHAIKIAQNKGIVLYSFVDHWTKIKERFYIAPSLLMLPDYILVIDDEAKKIAIESGLPPEKIIIIGNPYHIWLSSWQSKISRNNFLEIHSIKTTNSKLILYAPDPLSNVDGINEYGFDELVITTSLISIINTNVNFFNDFVFLLKPHPNQNLAELNKILNGHDKILLLSQDIGVNECIYFADIIIGFFSSLLIEAKIQKKSIIRIYEGFIDKDPFKNQDIGVLTNVKGLIKIMKNLEYER